MKKNIYLFNLIGMVSASGFLLIASPRFAYAQQYVASDSAQTTEASASSVIQISKTDTNASEQEKAGAVSILRNLERLAKDDEQKEQLSDAYDEVTEKKKGFIAQVVSVKDQSIKVATDKGEMFLVPDKSTTLIKKTESATADTVSLAEWFTVDDWLVVIGVESGDDFLPRRISTAPNSLEPPEQFMQRGALKTIQKTKIEIVPDGDTTAESFLITAKTILQNSDGSELVQNKFTKDTPVIVVGTIGSNNSKTAGIIRALSYIE